MVKVDLKGVHRVKKPLAGGKMGEYHYVCRGGPKFWSHSSDFAKNSAEYVAEFVNKSKKLEMPKIPEVAFNKSTAGIVQKYRNSVAYTNKKPRTKRDYDKYLTSFEKEFGKDSIKMFEEPDSVAEIRLWKEQWVHSKRQYDYATTVATLLLNWAVEEDKSIATHHHHNMKKSYKSDRSTILWSPKELSALIEVANEREKRVVVAASEGGLTPQDIGILKREHVEETPLGRRLYFKRTKNGKAVSIPITPALADLIDSTPPDQENLVVSLDGRPLRPERASQIIADLKRRANKKAREEKEQIQKTKGEHQKEPKYVYVREELRLYDMRGTAATELLRAGCSLEEIATTMGWGIRHASNIIEKYAALVPEKSDDVLLKLMAARGKQKEKSK